MKQDDLQGLWLNGPDCLKKLSDDENREVLRYFQASEKAIHAAAASTRIAIRFDEIHVGDSVGRLQFVRDYPGGPVKFAQVELSLGQKVDIFNRIRAALSGNGQDERSR